MAPTTVRRAESTDSTIYGWAGIALCKRWTPVGGPDMVDVLNGET